MIFSFNSYLIIDTYDRRIVTSLFISDLYEEINGGENLLPLFFFFIYLF